MKPAREKQGACVCRYRSPDKIFTSSPPRAGFLLNQCYNSSISTYPMSEEQLKAFLEKVQADTSLQEQLKAEGADPVAIAKEEGFSISADDIKRAQPTEALSDEELEDVAGGTIHFIIHSIQQHGTMCGGTNGVGCGG